MQNVIFYFFSFFIEAIVLWQYSSSLFVASQKTRLRFAILCIFYLILFAVSILGIKWLNMILYLLVNFIFMATLFRIKWYLAFFHSSVLSAVMGMCELAVYSIIGRFIPHFWANAEHFHNKIIFTVFAKTMFLTIFYILIHFFKGQQKQNQKNDHSVLLLAFIPITSVFVMVTFVNISDAFALSPNLTWMVTLSAAFLLVINLLVFGINQYNQKKNMEFTEMQLLLQKEADSAEYYEMLRLQNENQRILIHDIKKHLQSIDLLNEQKESEKITAYIRQLILSSDLKESARLCDHEMLNSILCRYMQQCNNSHITFRVDIRSGTTDFIADNDLTSLFCNLLDNAMEAVNSIPDAYIELNAGKREKTPFVVITMINSCRNDPFADQLGSLNTHKPNKTMHGFGLKSIRKTISKYNGNMQMYYDNDTLTFHTIITLKQFIIPYTPN